jgi:hypothetical protein
MDNVKNAPDCWFHVRSDVFDQLLLPASLPAACTARRIQAARRQVSAGGASRLACSAWAEVVRDVARVPAQLASALFGLAASYLARFVVNNIGHVFWLAQLKCCVR